MNKSSPDVQTHFSLTSGGKQIARDLHHRLSFILSFLPSFSLSLAALIPRALAASNESASRSDPEIVKDAHYLADFFKWREWADVANNIRRNADRLTCNENLSVVLAAAGELEKATHGAANGALTLLPTAGALIGSPTKELWVVYKLMPLAGILSMCLSLGGNIVPANANDYELNPATFSYGGLIATQHEDTEAEDVLERQNGLESAKGFAVKVKLRSQDPRGGTKYVRVWYGIFIQILLIGVLLGACWFTQSGSVLVWWCKVCSSCSCFLIR